MSTKGMADIVFCIDGSGSMQPCIDGVRQHIGSFLDGLESDLQTDWDVRFDFVAHRAEGDSDGGVIIECMTTQIGHAGELSEALYDRNGSGLFTTNVSEFKSALDRVDPRGDEASLLFLDFALDFPWRDRHGVHRVVVLMTDERPEDGQWVARSAALMDRLVDKIQALKVNLFVVGPDSALLEHLASADKAEWEIVPGGNGLRGTNFSKLLNQIARSVSKSQSSGQAPPVADRALFGQDNLGAGRHTDWSGR